MGPACCYKSPTSFSSLDSLGLGGVYDSYGVGQLLPSPGTRRRTARRKPDRGSHTGRRGSESSPGVMSPRTAPIWGRPPSPQNPLSHQVFVEPLERAGTRAIGCPPLCAATYHRKGGSATCAVWGKRRSSTSVPSDRRKIVYKGLLTCAQLKTYYPELSDKRVKSSLVLIHARFSTNTLGTSNLARPLSLATVHNRRNQYPTRKSLPLDEDAGEADLACDRFGEAIHEIEPVTSEGFSDTAVFDNVLELLLEAGRDLPHALRTMIPEAWSKDRFHGRKATGVLRLSFHRLSKPRDETCPGGGHRRVSGGCRPGPKRTASVSLLCDQGPQADHGKRNRGSGNSPRAKSSSRGACGPGQLSPRRSPAGADRFTEEEIFDELTRRPCEEPGCRQSG